ncbi:MAG: hypothetical protein AB3N11_03445, partial [Arenibacterium sp.]
MARYKPLEPAALRQRIDALLLADDEGMATWPERRDGEPHRLTYRFETDKAADFPWNDVATPVAFPDAQKAAIREALDKFEAV